MAHEVKTYGCDYGCGFKSNSLVEVEDHEQECYKNPYSDYCNEKCEYYR